MAELNEPLDPVAKRRKRLRYHCWHRGTKEMDLLLGRFADAHIAAMNESQLGEMEALLLLPDPDLYNWITGQAPVPDNADSATFRLIKDFYNGT